MNKYKIKVNDEDESKEVISLLVQLGYWDSESDRFGFVYTLGKKIGCDRLTHWDYYTGLGCKELTLPQLRDLVAQSKNEQGLISGADAKLAWAKGEYVEVNTLCAWIEIKGDMPVSIFDREDAKFRLKPRTITLNLEIPAPFEPNEGEEFFILSPLSATGYTKVQGITTQVLLDEYVKLGSWRTEEEIKQVVAAWRGGIKA